MIRVWLLTSGRLDADTRAHLGVLATMTDVQIVGDDAVDETWAGIARSAASVLRHRGNIDVVISSGESALAVTRLAWRGRPTAHIVGGLMSPRHRELARSQAVRGNLRLVTTSPAVARVATQTITDGRHIRLIRPAPLPSTLTRDAIRDRLGVLEGQPLIFIPGQRRPGSNHRLALWTTGLLASRDPSLRVLIDGPEPRLIRFAKSMNQAHALRHDDSLTDADRAIAADVALCAADAATEWTALAAIRDAGTPVVALRAPWNRDRLHWAAPATTLVEFPKARLLARAVLDVLDLPRAPSAPDQRCVTAESDWRDLLEEVTAGAKTCRTV